MACSESRVKRFRIGDVVPGDLGGLKLPCWHKERFDYFVDAEAWRLTLVAKAYVGQNVRDPDHLESYRCRACGRWHVGHTKEE